MFLPLFDLTEIGCDLIEIIYLPTHTGHSYILIRKKQQPLIIFSNLYN